MQKPALFSFKMCIFEVLLEFTNPGAYAHMERSLQAASLKFNYSLNLWIVVLIYTFSGVTGITFKEFGFSLILHRVTEHKDNNIYLS